MQSASREPIEGVDALDVLRGIRHLHVAKGRKTISFDLEGDRPADDVLLDHLLGRSGKLRAPTVRVGDVLVVGYNEELIRSLLG